MSCVFTRDQRQTVRMTAPVRVIMVWLERVSGAGPAPGSYTEFDSQRLTLKLAMDI